MGKKYLSVTQEAGVALFKRNIQGEIVMLNLLRFRSNADYSQSPELAEEKEISGRAAFQKYIDHTVPFLEQSGGSLLFLGEGGDFLIGPSDEKWDLAMLVKQKSVQDFMAFESNAEYMKGLGHRTAALEDSRILPLVSREERIF